MEHLVRFTTPEGRDAQHVAPSLDDALRFVERLRNNEEANAVHLYRLHEVPLAFKAYYRAEVAPAAPGEPVDAVDDLVGAAVTPAALPADVRPAAAAGAPTADVDSPEQQARKLFSRG